MAHADITPNTSDALNKLAQATKVMDCTHTYTTYDFEGNAVEVQWSRMFCPDCGLRLEAPGPTKPFHLKPHQR